MALPELVAAQAERALTAYCERRIPVHVRAQLRLEHQSRGDALTLVERRPVWNDAGAEWTAMPIARFQYDRVGGTWALWYCGRRNRWHPYEVEGSAKRLEDLLELLDRDRSGVFWG